MIPPTLFVFAGLPGSGKTTLSRGLARRLRAAHLRIDTVEQGLRELCGIAVEGEGYGLAYRIAEDNLRLGVDVVADACNPIELTRRAWAGVAARAGARVVFVEVVCSDASEHRRRVEGRRSDIPGLRLPTWAEVEAREVEPWATERLILDTAGRAPGACLEALISGLAEGGSLSAPPPTR